MTEPESSNGYGLRKRRKVVQTSDTSEAGLKRLLELAGTSNRIVVFSGSGLSASSGMSTFSTRGGLYERAQKKFKLADGKSLFTYTFFDKQRTEAQAFFADIYSEALRAEPAEGHYALRQLFDAGRLARHYTLNIDGLAAAVGMDTWHHERNTSGVTVEMHGNVHHLVCPECHATLTMNPALLKQIKSKQPLPCSAPGCGKGLLRFKVMMYDDGEAECITPDDVMDQMEEDVKAADLVLWVGISFQQSASTMYFRKARGWIQEAGRLRGDSAVQAIINPSEDALFNLLTAMSNQAELNVLQVLAESDEVLPLLADRLRRGTGATGGAVHPPRSQQPRRAQEPRAEQQQQQEGEVAVAAVPVAARQPGFQALAPQAVQQPALQQQRQQQQQQPGGLVRPVALRPPQQMAAPLAPSQQALMMQLFSFQNGAAAVQNSWHAQGQHAATAQGLQAMLGQLYSHLQPVPGSGSSGLLLPTGTAQQGKQLAQTFAAPPLPLAASLLPHPAVLLQQQQPPVGGAPPLTTSFAAAAVAAGSPAPQLQAQSPQDVVSVMHEQKSHDSEQSKLPSVLPQGQDSAADAGPVVLPVSLPAAAAVAAAAGEAAP